MLSWSKILPLCGHQPSDGQMISGCPDWALISGRRRRRREEGERGREREGEGEGEGEREGESEGERRGRKQK